MSHFCGACIHFEPVGALDNTKGECRWLHNTLNDESRSLPKWAYDNTQYVESYEGTECEAYANNNRPRE